ncbi:pyruvate-flavodoxin oxidoreductase, putative [Entamoeba invadens IP1]|uniref:Pyruvate-flavodoxin oxidoreductase, putative n=1 Tax=Entamoeba invadens IP1 TaxID=370355 RepID=A0A0A1U1F4_ENTIV|nr:pyruvate-flavodoxin oxidoreductase, putative [Entamoeba invadens IP1]ELP87874.1 pyruvate-flavodoxin oxidoreductase, putative [Entamoeba invadens IP1]|eukprot:XP_004254645.1 pyruvate-flavodoxin oxidoreductase, putative [Entamoeba invadens IP1]
MSLIDGCHAVAQVAYYMSDTQFIFPISPATSIGETCEEMSASHVKNMYGNVTSVIEMESELGSIASVHGSALTGAIPSTFTSSQGLLLMPPNMFKIAGELLPAVIHVASRNIGASGMTVFCDNTDVLSCRSTGFCYLTSNTPQESYDFAVICYMATIEASLPFLHFFDGFKTGYALQKVSTLEPNDLFGLINKKQLEKHRQRRLSPHNPTTQTLIQCNDTTFQAMERTNEYYNRVPEIVQNCFNKFEEKTGRKYNVFDLFGDTDAEVCIIAFGSVCGTIRNLLLEENKKLVGEKVCLIEVRLILPFSVEKLIEKIPKTTKKIVVLDKTKEPGANGEPLYQAVCSALNEADMRIKVHECRYGLGGKEMTPSMILSIIKNIAENNKLKTIFTIGIDDDVTHLSLSYDSNFTMKGADFEVIIYGVSGVPISKTILSSTTKEEYVQGFKMIDMAKEAGMVRNDLRISKREILSQFEIEEADVVFVLERTQYFVPVLKDIKKNGILVISEDCESFQQLSLETLETVLRKNVRVFFKKMTTEDCVKEVLKMRTGNHSFDEADYKGGMYKQKIEKIIEEKRAHKKVVNDKYYTDIVLKIENGHGNELKVSDMVPGFYCPTGQSQFNKRRVNKRIPHWDINMCQQCSTCSIVCPSSSSRIFALDVDHPVPDEFKMKNSTKGNYKYRVQVSPEDCMGCNSCASSCKSKAITMLEDDDNYEEQVRNWKFAMTIPDFEKKSTIEELAMNKPLLEFANVCTGCGEMASVKMATQLFGKRMVCAMTSGCSSVSSGVIGMTAFTKDANGRGPTYGNSLLEDNMEYAFGMAVSLHQNREILVKHVNTIVNNKTLRSNIGKEFAKLLEEWLVVKEDGDKAEELCAKIEPLLKEIKSEEDIVEVQKYAEYFHKIEAWSVIGDGAAFDIGTAGVDHVASLHVGLKTIINNTQVFSNTGGHHSKATPEGAISKFASKGTDAVQKDLASILINYGTCYVAQCCVQANPEQAMKALIEAERFNGPAFVIFYCVCVDHKFDLHNAIEESRLLVQNGYWNLFRYDPSKKGVGVNPLTLDSECRIVDFSPVIMNEDRFSLLRNDDDKTKQLVKGIQNKMQEKLDELVKQTKN